MGLLRSCLHHPVARKQPLATANRIIAWQLRKRLWREEQIFTYVNDTRLIARTGWPVTSACRYFGFPEFESMSILMHVVRSEDLFVDVGAHVGSYTIALASRGARVVAIEPDTHSRAFLIEHIDLNQLELTTEVMSDAAGQNTSTAFMSNHLGQQNHIIHDPSGFPVKVRSVDAMLDGRIPFAMKIDVEGYELQVLHGADHALSSCQLLCVETMALGTRFGTSDHEVMAHVTGRGFREVNYNPFTRTVTGTSDAKGMRVFIRDLDLINQRIRSAEPFTICGLRI